MKKLLLVLALLLPIEAHAGFQYFNTADRVGIVGHDDECTIELNMFLLLMLAKEGVDIKAFKRAEVATHEKAFAACWADLGDGKVFIVDEFGGGGFIEIGKGV
jgi:hypothetical protein